MARRTGAPLDERIRRSPGVISGPCAGNRDRTPRDVPGPQVRTPAEPRARCLKLSNVAKKFPMTMNSLSIRRAARRAAAMVCGCALAALLVACKDEKKRSPFADENAKGAKVPSPQELLAESVEKKGDGTAGADGAKGAAPPGHGQKPSIATMNKVSAASLPAFTDLKDVARPRLAADAKLTAVEIAGASFEIPADWEAVAKDKLSAMRLAQFNAPVPAGAPASTRRAELVLFAFGPGQGGAAEMNLVRWIGQVKQENETQKPLLYRLERGGLKISVVRMDGSLMPSGMGVGPTEPLPGSGFYGLICEGLPGGTVFFRATGSKEAIDAAMPGLIQIEESIKGVGNAAGAAAATPVKVETH